MTVKPHNNKEKRKISGMTGRPLNLLSGSFTVEKLKEIIQPASEWRPFPTASEHDRWQALPEKVRGAHVRQAEKHLNGEWETLRASVFLDFVRNGNRCRYEAVFFGRRQKLAELIIGECIEGRGRFMDDILDGLWTICEETYWGIPAHLDIQERGPGLPDVTEPTVDLFAAETGMLLAWTDYLLGEQLDKISPLIRQRIGHEMERRILSVNRMRNDFWWMNGTNNWNPWICSNWLTAVLLMEKNQERRILSVHKIMRSLDAFLNAYPPDGGCDEGPLYWTRAGASLYDCLELLRGVSQGGIDIFDHPLIKNIGRYILRVHIADRYYINFADAGAKGDPDASVVFRYGRSIHDKDMMGFGAFLARQQHLDKDSVRGRFDCLGRILPALFNLDELLKARPKEPLARDCWLPDLQVMGARSVEESTDGLYLAAKSGHNAESHNHNDVGSFIVYAGGYPALIDVGVETYTAKTFGNRRYEIWTMQSAYHNLPTINGVMQKNGREFAAKNVIYRSDAKSATLSLDISKAYPEEAQVKSWIRTLTLERGKRVIIQEKYALKAVEQPLQLTLMSWRKPEIMAEGKIHLENPGEIQAAQPVIIFYDQDRLSVKLETISIADDHLRQSWDHALYRIILILKQTPLQGEFAFRLEQ